MSERVQFTAFKKHSYGGNATSEILVDGEQVGDIERATGYATLGSKASVVSEYTVTFFDERYAHIKTHNFVVESNPLYFERKVRQMAREAESRDPNSPVIFVGPFDDARAGLAAAKDFVRAVVRGEG